MILLASVTNLTIILRLQWFSKGMNLPFHFYPKYYILVMKHDLSFHSWFQWKKNELSLLSALFPLLVKTLVYYLNLWWYLNLQVGQYSQEL